MIFEVFLQVFQNSTCGMFCFESNLSNQLIHFTGASHTNQSDRTMDEDVMSGRDVSRTPAEQTVLIHGLSVERYRSIYSSVLQPSVLSTLLQSKHADYVCRVLELKQSLWTALSRPRLQETLMEDGWVQVTEILDLTSY